MVPTSVVIVSVKAKPDDMVTIVVAVTIGGVIVTVEVVGAGVTVARRKEEQSCLRTVREGFIPVEVPVTARAQLSCTSQHKSVDHIMLGSKLTALHAARFSNRGLAEQMAAAARRTKNFMLKVYSSTV